MFGVGHGTQKLGPNTFAGSWVLTPPNRVLGLTLAWTRDPRPETQDPNCEI